MSAGSYDGYESYGEGEYSDYGEDYSDSYESEECEPTLKYSRLGGDLLNVLADDSASCMGVSDKNLAVGTHGGQLCLLDFGANLMKTFSHHHGTINEIRFSRDGEYVASCSDDGKICINGLYKDETLEFVYPRPVKSVCLDPHFSMKETRQFVSGGLAGQVLINKKGWFSSKDRVLYSNANPIYATSWRGSTIVWGQSSGIRLYDLEAGAEFSHIGRSDDTRPDLYRCNIVWASNSVVITGWADAIHVVRIERKPRRIDDLSDTGSKKTAQIISNFRLDYFVAGLAPFADGLAVLAVYGDSDDVGGVTAAAHRRYPQLEMLTYEGESTASDVVPVEGWDELQAHQLRLEHLEGEMLYYLISPQQVVCAMARDIDDHIEWLLNHKEFEEALSAAERNADKLHRHSLETIGGEVLKHLIAIKEIDRAAAVCPRILKQNAGAWEEWVHVFRKIGELSAIAPYVPLADPQLDPKIYALILQEFCAKDPERFLRTIREWPHDRALYKIEDVIQYVMDELRTIHTDTVLTDALAELYTYSGAYDKALHTYLQLGRGDVFSLIETHNLYESVRQKVVLLMRFDQSETIKLLTAHTTEIPIATVVEQLSSERRLLHEYLHALFIMDAHIASDFHELQVPLYADYAYELLLPFLKQSNYYPLEKALETVSSRELFPEMVFILGRMGNHKQALELIISKLRDVEYAIEFVQGENDDELWDDLIEKSINNPKFVGGLLENIGSHVDPIKLINRIPDGMKIDGLRDKLVKIISDFNLQMSLREGCKRIIVHDCVVLARRLNKDQKRGLTIAETTRCPLCNGETMVAREREGLVPFYCGHVYHESCISPGGGVEALIASSEESGNKVWCMICQNQARAKGGNRQGGRNR